LLPDGWHDKANCKSLVCSLFGFTDKPSSCSCRLMLEPLKKKKKLSQCVNGRGWLERNTT
jgi:hypothetical protein